MKQKENRLKKLRKRLEAWKEHLKAKSRFKLPVRRIRKRRKHKEELPSVYVGEFYDNAPEPLPYWAIILGSIIIFGFFALLAWRHI